MATPNPKPDIQQTVDLSVVAPFDFAGTADLSIVDGLPAPVSAPFDPRSETETRQLPGYAAEEKIGHGAYGAVWSATHASTRQRVAIKVLRSGPRQGFQREVQRILQVAEHPHIVPLVDARLENDPPFLVTPLMQGSMGGYIRQTDKPQEVESALVRLWMKQVAAALEFVHSQGIVHCDLKPDNILLDDQGNCRVCDFGQATLLGEEGSSLGTYFFMSPEQTLQSEGRSGVLPVWDIYSLGATFYFLATGVHARGSEKLRQAVSQEEDPRQRLRLYREGLLATPLTPCRQFNPGLDSELAEIIERCLHVDPQQRFHTATEVTTALSASGRRQHGSTSLYQRRVVEQMRATGLGRMLSGQLFSSADLNLVLMWLGMVLLPLTALFLAVLRK